MVVQYEFRMDANWLAVFGGYVVCPVKEFPLEASDWKVSNIRKFPDVGSLINLGTNDEVKLKGVTVHLKANKADLVCFVAPQFYNLFSQAILNGINK